MKIGILIISFLLDGVVSKFLPINSIFYPLFTLVGLICSYSYFYGDKIFYYKCAFVLGFVYDLIYTDTFAFYAFLFLLIAFLITKISSVLNNNYINLVFLTIICIVLFRSITYLLIVITGNISFNAGIWFKGIYSSIILNIIYALILRLFTNFIDMNKRRKKRYY